MKHSLNIFLRLVLLAAPVAAQAQLNYRTNGNTMSITGYTGPAGDLVIPATINGMLVTTIGEVAFYNCASLTSITMPAGVTNIGNQPFDNCTNLIAIIVDTQNAVYSSLNGVLFDKSQSTLLQYPEARGGSYTIPGSVEIIAGEALSGCSGLTSVSIPGSVSSIGYGAFSYDASLGTATIPATISNISGALFAGCPSLTNVYFQGNAPTVGPSEPIFNPPVFDGDSIATAYYLPGTTGWSNTYDGIPAVQLAQAATREFNYTTNGRAINITGYNCSGGLLVIPAAINGLPVTSIGPNAFAFCTHLTIVAIPGSVTNIGSGAFEFCTGLTDLVILSGVASIGQEAFEGCYSLGSIVIPAGVKSIGTDAFEGCVNLSGVFFLPGITNIGEGAFEGCVSLSSLALPATVTTIGNNAFDSCFSLKNVYFYGDAPAVGAGVFSNDLVSTVYYSPCATGWGATFAGIPAEAVTASDQFNYVSFDGMTILVGYTGSCGVLVIPNNVAGFPVSEVGDRLYGDTFAEGNSILTSVTIPGSVTSIGDYAFNDCTNLRSVTINEGVTTIGDWVFAQCYSLSNISIPRSMTNIGRMILSGAPITTLPSNITTLGFGEFSSTGLTNITIPPEINTITEYAFAFCPNLTNVTMHDGVSSIGVYSFYGDPLTSLTIPASVTLIGGDAFKFCNVLTNVYFKGNAPSVSGGAEAVFYYDSSATAYYMPGTTGWNSTYQEIPSVLWNPLIQTGGGNFGVQNNQFGFDIKGTAGIPIVVEASTNLGDPVWTALTNVMLTNGLFHFSEPAQPASAGRFYRIGSP